MLMFAALGVFALLQKLSDGGLLLVLFGARLRRRRILHRRMCDARSSAAWWCRDLSPAVCPCACLQPGLRPPSASG